MEAKVPTSSPPKRNFRGVSPDERVAQRRAQLLEAGLEAFGTAGYHASGVREICARAKLTERYFYESFKNREALMAAVYDRAVKALEASLMQALAEAPRDARALTRAGLRATFGAFRRDPRVARVVLIEMLLAGGADAAFVVSDSFATMIARLAEVLYPDAHSQGIDPKIIAHGLYGATISIAMRWTMNGFDEPLESIVEHCALFYDSLLTELTARRDGAQEL